MSIRKLLRTPSLRRRIAGISMLFILLSSVTIGLFSYQMAKSAVESTMGNTALSIGDSLCSIIDAEQFSTLQTPTDAQKAYYGELQTKLNDTLHQTGLQYLYTMRKTDDGQFIYVVDGSDDCSALGDVEPDVSDLLRAGAEGQPAFAIITDGWGTSITAYLPIIADSGNIVGILGVDFDGTDMVNRLNQLKLYIVGIVFLILIITFFFERRLANNIVTPILDLTKIADKLADGDVDVAIHSQSSDEIGQLTCAFQKMVSNIQHQAHLVETMAAGDLTSRIEIRSEKDILDLNLETMVVKFSAILNEINVVSQQLVSQSESLSDSSTAISQGATEQASAIEQLSASIEEIAAQTDVNVQSAEHSDSLTEIAKNYAGNGSMKMNEMLGSMDEISTASNNIRRIIKVIDNIAFQTNILALNAAVEASRAGAAGKGFAVVAEEVRSLAAKSADAANNTTQIIEASIKSVQNGMKTARETADVLAQIVEKIQEAADIAKMISASSSQQAEAIAQIKSGIAQVSTVVQTNAASTEESAAASSELADQAAHLKKLVSVFTTK